MRPMRTAAAQWELEGPRITGPITSLKMLGGREPSTGAGWIGKVLSDALMEAKVRGSRQVGEAPGESPRLAPWKPMQTWPGGPPPRGRL